MCHGDPGIPFLESEAAAGAGLKEAHEPVVEMAVKFWRGLQCLGHTARDG